MADSKEDIASQALSRLGEGAISSFDEDTDTAEKVRQLYEPTILGLLGRYNWRWAQQRAVLSEDGAAVPLNEWRYGYLMPTLRLTRVGAPLRVFNSTVLRAPEVFDWELEGKHIFTNYETLVIEYVARKPESVWPGYFEEMIAEALAARLALPITENASKEELHSVKAFGNAARRWRAACSVRPCAPMLDTCRRPRSSTHRILSPRPASADLAAIRGNGRCRPRGTRNQAPSPPESSTRSSTIARTCPSSTPRPSGSRTRSCCRRAGPRGARGCAGATTSGARSPSRPWRAIPSRRRTAAPGRRCSTPARILSSRRRGSRPRPPT
jgi:hypothetical protein